MDLLYRPRIPNRRTYSRNGRVPWWRVRHQHENGRLLPRGLAGAGRCAQCCGDLDLDGIIDLTDAIIALQVMSGISTLNQPQISYADVNQDGRIGLPEAIYVLQEVAGLR